MPQTKPITKRHTRDVNQLCENLATFLAEPNHSGDSGWPEIPQAELNKGFELMNSLALLKWGVDSDQDMPVSINILDRKRFSAVTTARLRIAPDEASPADQEAILVSNLNQLELGLAEIQQRMRTTLAQLSHIAMVRESNAAACDVFVNRYRPDSKPKDESFIQTFHLTKEDAENYSIPFHHVVTSVTRTVRPAFRFSREDNFAEWRNRLRGKAGMIYNTREAFVDALGDRQ